MAPPTSTPTVQPTVPPKPIGAFESKQYRNLFAELLGKNEAEIQQKIDRRGSSSSTVITIRSASIIP
jgi:hypothetical protein